MKRCDWSANDEIYIEYHDKEWGVPVYEDGKLFEMLILEGAQAGLSWITILKRRESYRHAYDNFDPIKMGKWDSNKITELLNNPEIVRNKLKVNAAKSNAQAYLKVTEKYGSFNSFMWSFVNGVPMNNAWKSLNEIPVSTKESERMSKELKKNGFKFVGPTICYAFMQAVGMVNDHIETCFRYKEITNI
ncbi:MAG: DNA-3-methyladenine glycosylase I [Desulfatiglandaceae bacterium]|jgi:DNA-3-methyladenine glycosylase I